MANIIKLTDVIHFYLGCECFIKLNKGGFSGKLILTTDLLAGYLSKKYHVGLILNLRKLDGITEEEAKVWLETYHNAAIICIGSKTNSGVWYGFMGATKKYFKNYEDFKHSWPDGFQYLLSKGFDLFGLIESGQAIDRNKQ